MLPQSGGTSPAGIGQTSPGSPRQRPAPPQEVDRPVQLLIGQRRVEADADHAPCLALRKGYAAAAQLVQEGRRPDRVNRDAGVALPSGTCPSPFRGEHVIHLAGEAQAAGPVYIIPLRP